MPDITLADALLLRKEYNLKVTQLAALKGMPIYETKVQRVKVTDSIDDLTMTVPKLSAAQVTEEYDHYSRALRLVDSAIQRANWSTMVTVDPHVMTQYGKGTVPVPAPSKPAAPSKKK